MDRYKLLLLLSRDNPRTIAEIDQMLAGDDDDTRTTGQRRREIGAMLASLVRRALVEEVGVKRSSGAYSRTYRLAASADGTPECAEFNSALDAYKLAPPYAKMHALNRIAAALPPYRAQLSPGALDAYRAAQRAPQARHATTVEPAAK